MAPKQQSITFEDLEQRQSIYLYAGNKPFDVRYAGHVGLSLDQSNSDHILHDIVKPFPIMQNCVDIFQSEDVFEHIETHHLTSILDDIYRILKPGGLFRLSVPDYRCDVLYHRSLKDVSGNVLHDPGGGGEYSDGKVINGGHVWFPTFEQVKRILEESQFQNVNFLHYYDGSGTPVTNKIDYSLGHIMRTPDHDARVQNPYRPMSLVVDCIK